MKKYEKTQKEDFGMNCASNQNREDPSELCGFRAPHVGWIAFMMKKGESA